MSILVLGFTRVRSTDAFAARRNEIESGRYVYGDRVSGAFKC